jgi:Cu-processing system ATP-binding protein
VGEVLERVGLAEAGRRRVRGYSRGMRQRLGLAVAILAEPELLILDEPTGGLDQEGLGVLWTVLQEWCEAGRTVLIASHDLALMERRVHQMCILRDGRVLADGTADDLRRAARLAHRVWFEVDEADPPRVHLLCEAMTKWGKGRVERRPGTVIVEVEPDAILELMEVQSGFPGTVRGLRVEEPTLDLIYDKLLGAA